MASRTQQLIILVTAKDMASRQLRGINRELGVLGRGMSPRGQMAMGAGKVAGGVFNVIERGAIAAAGGIVLAAKAGMDFQDAMAGVAKTVEGTPQELAKIYEGLRALSTRVPIKFEDLAGIAQQAGALGVPTKNILTFTEAVARVTAAGTGLDEAQVAETFGKLGTLFHLTGPQFSQMGSALVTLGNNASSSESDIVKMALRFGGLGEAVGLSVPQVLAWSSAVASLGPLAEAGGSSLTRMFGRVVQYAGTGDKKFTAFAKAAGMSEKAFRALVKSDTSAAMQKFIGGLRGMDKLQLQKTLKLAGIVNVRDVQAIQALANNPSVLADALVMANKAWIENNALTEISNKRFDTLKAHWTEFTNILRNALVDISEGLNPALDRALKKMSAVFLDPKMRGELKQLGKDIGDAIDRIDWQKAVSAVKTLVGYAKQFVDVLMSLPPELLAGIGGASLLNKVSGGLLGAGISDLIGGAVRAGLGQVVGRGSAANPMWVTWRGLPPGGGAGGLGGVAGGGGKGAAVLNLLGKITIVGLAAEIASEVAGPIQDAAADIHKQYFANTPMDEFGKAWNNFRATADWPLGQRNAPDWASLGGGTPSEKAMSSLISSAGYKGFEGRGPGYRPPDAISSAVLKKLDQLHQDFLVQFGLLKKGSPEAAKTLADEMVKGAGSVSSTKAVIAELKRQAVMAKDPETRKIFADAARRIEGKLPGREWIAAQEADARTIVASNESTGRKIADLKEIQRQLLAKGDTTAAAIVGALLGSVVPAINGVTAAVGGIHNVTTTIITQGPGGRPIFKKVPKTNAAGDTQVGGVSGAGAGADIYYDPKTHRYYRKKKRAMGGPVFPGSVYQVGENGPETFVPRMAGMIVPGGHRQAGSMQPIVIHMHAPSARDTVRADRSWRRYGNGRSVGIG